MKAEDFIKLEGWEMACDVANFSLLQEIPIDDFDNLVVLTKAYTVVKSYGSVEGAIASATALKGFKFFEVAEKIEKAVQTVRHLL